eukprot:UN07406
MNDTSTPTDAPHRVNKESDVGIDTSVPSRSRSSRHSRVFSLQLNQPPQDKLNQKALDVLNRVSNKLRGRDFDESSKLNVKEQVQRLIDQAANHENFMSSMDRMVSILVDFCAKQT